MAGVVTKVGSKVSKFKVGDEVYARPETTKFGSIFNSTTDALKLIIK